MKVLMNIDKTYKEMKVVIHAPEHNEMVESFMRHLALFHQIHQKNILSIKTKEGIEILQQDDIEYLEVFKDVVIIYTIKGVYETRIRLYQLLEKLPTDKFLQISKSTAMNIDHLERLENYFSGGLLAITKNGRKIPITRLFVQKIKKTLNI